MSTRELGAALAALALATTGAFAAGPDLGQPITAEEIAAWDISVPPSGDGLPPGSGTAAQGAAIFAQKCVGCHGANARGGANVTLVGGGPIERIDSVRTIRNFWPYSTTVFDYIRRAMPWPQPRTLSNDEVYALTAYILSENKLIAADAVMNATTLPQVKMPNRDGFIVRFPGEL
jgi:mono/diheme cytochrome c family protein